MMSAGQTGAANLSFESTPTPAYSQVREIKFCEANGCGRNFLRLRPSIETKGQTYCPPCSAREETLAEARDRAQAKDKESRLALAERTRTFRAAQKAFSILEQSGSEQDGR